jgi:hypothetical protein
VFGMGTGGTLALGSPKVVKTWLGRILNNDGHNLKLQKRYCIVFSKFYGQAERAISNGQLNVLLRLHIRPINVVVFHGPS